MRISILKQCYETSLTDKIAMLNVQVIEERIH